MKFIMLFFFSANVWAGGSAGNGGDSVNCRPSTLNEFAGDYSLDYLVQYTPDTKIVSVNTLEDSLDRIEKLLREKLPELADNFHEFKVNVFNISDPNKKYYWEKAPFGLIDLKDESVVSQLPENCRDGDKIKIVQAVIRMNSDLVGLPTNKLLFRFVPEVTEKLKTTNPVQLSFLIVHEWLWNFSDNVDRNRRLNYWLHSILLETWSRDEILKNLLSIGFTVPFLQTGVHSVADKKVMEYCQRVQNRITQAMVKVMSNRGAVNPTNDFQIGSCELKKGEAILTLPTKFKTDAFYYNGKPLPLEVGSWPFAGPGNMTYSFFYEVTQYDSLGYPVSYEYDFREHATHLIYVITNMQTGNEFAMFNYSDLVNLN